jgi:hypothetical protein
MISVEAGIISLNSENILIFVTLKCSVLFEVRTEYVFRWASAEGYDDLYPAPPTLHCQAPFHIAT